MIDAICFVAGIIGLGILLGASLLALGDLISND